jgi:hypothetical protein
MGGALRQFRPLQPQGGTDRAFPRGGLQVLAFGAAVLAAFV